MPRRVRTVLKTEEGQIGYWRGGPKNAVNNAFPKNLEMHVHDLILQFAATFYDGIPQQVEKMQGRGSRYLLSIQAVVMLQGNFW